MYYWKRTTVNDVVTEWRNVRWLNAIEIDKICAKKELFHHFCVLSNTSKRFVISRYATPSITPFINCPERKKSLNRRYFRKSSDFRLWKWTRVMNEDNMVGHYLQLTPSVLSNFTMPFSAITNREKFEPVFLSYTLA